MTWVVMGHTFSKITGSFSLSNAGFVKVMNDKNWITYIISKAISAI